MGGFPHCGMVKDDYVMIKTMLYWSPEEVGDATSVRVALEEIKLKFIDTSSKFGHGRFQTAQERQKFYGRLKS